MTEQTIAGKIFVCTIYFNHTTDPINERYFGTNNAAREWAYSRIDEKTYFLINEAMVWK